MSLRNGKSYAPQPSAMDESKSNRTPSVRVTSQRPSSYLLLVYPIVLALGSAFAQLSPIANTNVQSATSEFTTTTNPIPELNYFAGKRNILNVYFVKIGWFWTTLAFVLLQLTARSSSSLTKSSKTTQGQKYYIQTIIRYTLITISWVLTTQWFFGPALVDRSFTLTGGHCELSTIPTTLPIDEQSTARINKLPDVWSATTCKLNGGHWRGGHDISGHVFMLVLSSAFLLYELYISDMHSPHPHISPSAAANLSHEMSEEEKNAVGGWETETQAKLRVWARRFVHTVVALDFWMLMMTAIWFHTWLEKLSGLVLAGSTIWGTYFLGEFVPAWDAIVGGF